MIPYKRPGIYKNYEEKKGGETKYLEKMDTDLKTRLFTILVDLWDLLNLKDEWRKKSEEYSDVRVSVGQRRPKGVTTHTTETSTPRKSAKS